MKKRVVAPATAKPFLRFHHSRQLRTRTDAVLAAIDRDEEPASHAEKLAAVVVELTEAGLNSFFVEPLKAAKVGFLLEQTATYGISSALMVVSPVLRNVISRMDGEQVLVVAAHLRRFMK
jgi:hypothetical protein